MSRAVLAMVSVSLSRERGVPNNLWFLDPLPADDIDAVRGTGKIEKWHA